MNRGIRDSAVARLVEKQMRNWEISRQQRLTETQPQRETLSDFVCLSRMVGIDDREVAEALGEHLGWAVFGKEILDAMSGDDETRRQIYASMDQRDLSWWEEVLRPFAQDEFVRNDYFRRLCKTVISLACQGSAVFVGRGADLILPRDRGFRVRVVAPLELRRAAWAARRGVREEIAEREIAQIEKLRREFFHNHFRIDVADPTRHDLVVNLASFSGARAVEIIVQARELHRREMPVGVGG